MSQLYFAYGSNLNPRGMEARCPAAVVVDRAALLDWKLAFRGVADIVPSTGSRVEGALWRCTPKCLRALDVYEGVPSYYRREWVEVQDRHGDTHRALTYVMCGGAIRPPSLGYLATIHGGFDWLRIPLDTLEDAVNESREETYHGRTLA